MWQTKQLLPRIKAFAWRLIRRAIPTGEKEARYSKHISKICCRCGLPEDDIHLFFSCSFARAARFHSPWHIRSDVIVGTNQNAATVMSNLLSQDHPHASIQNVFTFLWCYGKVETKSSFLIVKKIYPTKLSLELLLLLIADKPILFMFPLLCMLLSPRI
jgi:hypothetical protein